MLKKIVLLSLVLLTSIPAFTEEENDLKFNFSSSFATKYIWRGMVLTDGPVLQPSGSLGFEGFNLNVWANLDLDDVNGLEYEFNEVDFTGSYSHSFEQINIDFGFLYYSFPNTDFDSTLELYFSVAFDTLLQPSITWYQDMDLVEGTYLSLAIGHELPLGESAMTLALASSLGWGSTEHNKFYYGYGEASLADFSASATLNIPVCEKVSIFPSVLWSRFLEDEIQVYFGDEDNFIFMIGASLDLEL